MTIFPELEADLRTLAQRSGASELGAEPQVGRQRGGGRLSNDSRRLGGRRLAVLVALCVLAFGGAATAAVLGAEALLATAPAGGLFRADPQIWNQDNHDHPAGDGVIQSSVKEAETLHIRGVGDIHYWVARTRHGGSCEAFKLPDGTWAGTSYAENVKYNFGGIVPGCHAPNQDGNVADGGGFDFDTDSFGPSPLRDKHAASDFTYVVFGTVDVTGAVQVRDVQTGRTTRIVDRKFFAISRPEHLRTTGPGHRPSTPRFQALDSSGKVLSTSWTQQHILKAAEERRGIVGPG